MNNGTTVFDALNSSFTVSYKEFAGLGKLITAISGVEQDSTHYWFYYVGDEFAQVSLDKYVLNKDSSVLFKLSADTFAQ